MKISIVKPFVKLWSWVFDPPPELTLSQKLLLLHIVEATPKRRLL